MSFNIRCEMAADTGSLAWAERMQPCRDMVADMIPDIIGMQEPRKGQWAQVREQYSDKYRLLHVLADDEVSDHDSMRIIILYDKDRFFRLSDGRFWLSDTPEVPSCSWNATDKSIRGALYAHLYDRYTGKTLWFVTTHYVYKNHPLDTEARRLSSELIVRKMKEIAGEDATIFVTGDFNSIDEKDGEHDTCLVPLFSWMGSARDDSPDTDRKISFNRFGKEWNGAMLDHIFYRNATPLVFRTIDSHDYGVYFISDHYPIMCTFTF